MTIDSIVFREEGNPSFKQNPSQNGVSYCEFCKAWHTKLKLEAGIEFCAFCNTTHHSRACRAGLRERCNDPSVDPIHNFLSQECKRQQRFDLNFCGDCNCFHSKHGWKICLENHKPKSNWSKERKLIWKMRWQSSRSSETERKVIMKRERNLFDQTEAMRLVPYEYPLSSAKFIRQSNL